MNKETILYWFMQVKKVPINADKNYIDFICNVAIFKSLMKHQRTQLFVAMNNLTCIF